MAELGSDMDALDSEEVSGSDVGLAGASDSDVDNTDEQPEGAGAGAAGLGTVGAKQVGKQGNADLGTVEVIACGNRATTVATGLSY